jgi:hypothetical protein
MLERKKGPLSKLYPLTKLVFLFCAIVLAVVFDWRFGYFGHGSLDTVFLRYFPEISLVLSRSLSVHCCFL